MNVVKKKAYYHLPGLFEFMICIEYSFLFIRSTESIFMTGARSVPFMVHRKAVSGAVEESDVEMKIRKKF